MSGTTPPLNTPLRLREIKLEGVLSVRHVKHPLCATLGDEQGVPGVVLVGSEPPEVSGAGGS